MKPNMKHLRRPRGYTKYIIPYEVNKHIIMNTSSFDIMWATAFPEVFYEDTDEQVPDGEPIGLDVEINEGVELVLFSNIYWSPQYDNYEDNWKIPMDRKNYSCRFCNSKPIKQ